MVSINAATTFHVKPKKGGFVIKKTNMFLMVVLSAGSRARLFVANSG